MSQPTFAISSFVLAAMDLQGPRGTLTITCTGQDADLRARARSAAIEPLKARVAQDFAVSEPARRLANLRNAIAAAQQELTGLEKQAAALRLNIGVRAQEGLPTDAAETELVGIPGRRGLLEARIMALRDQLVPAKSAAREELKRLAWTGPDLHGRLAKEEAAAFERIMASIPADALDALFVVSLARQYCCRPGEAEGAVADLLGDDPPPLVAPAPQRFYEQRAPMGIH